MAFIDPGGGNRTASGMPSNPWRTRLKKASYKGASFWTESDGITSGRRIAHHEYPKRNDGYAEDMGRRARRHFMMGYVIGPNYIQDRDRLQKALESNGKGKLQ